MLERQVLKYLYGNYPVAILMTLTLGAMMVSVVFRENNQQAIIYWFAVLTFFQLLRLGDFLYYRIAKQGEVYSFVEMYRNFRFGTLLTGIVLGVFPLFLVNTVSLTEMFFVAFVYAGLTAGATSSLGVDRVSLYLYMLPVLLPLTFCFFSIGGFMAVVMGFMIPLYMVYLLLNSNRYLSRLTENVLLREEAQKRERELSRSQSLAELIVKIQAAYLDGNVNNALIENVLREVIKLTASDFAFICRVRKKSENEIDSNVLVNLGELGLDKLHGGALRIDELNVRPLTLEAYFSQVIITGQDLEVDHIEIMQGSPLTKILGNFYGIPLKSEGEVIGVIGLIFTYDSMQQGLPELLLPLLHSLERILIGKKPDRRSENRQKMHAGLSR